MTETRGRYAVGQKPERTSSLEQAFDNAWTYLRGPELVREYRFAPPRQWRFDRAHVGAKVAVECEGGQFSQGRHFRPRAYAEDCAKYNRAIALGWRVFRLTTSMLDEAPVQHLTPIIEAIGKEGQV